MGPLNNEPTAAKTERHVTEALERGATAGHRRASARRSTAATCSSKPPCWTGSPTRWRSPERRRSARWCRSRRSATKQDAIDLVKDSPYGLLSAIFTKDLGRGLRFAEAVRTGWVNVNEGTNYWESHLPFGGRAGSQSGVGRVGGRFSMERLTELKTIVVNWSRGPARWLGLEARSHAALLRGRHPRLAGHVPEVPRGRGVLRRRRARVRRRPDGQGPGADRPAERWVPRFLPGTRRGVRGRRPRAFTRAVEQPGFYWKVFERRRVRGRRKPTRSRSTACSTSSPPRGSPSGSSWPRIDCVARASGST